MRNINELLELLMKRTNRQVVGAGAERILAERL